MKYELPTALDSASANELWARATSGESDVEVAYPMWEPAPSRV